MLVILVSACGDRGSVGTEQATQESRKSAAKAEVVDTGKTRVRRLKAESARRSVPIVRAAAKTYGYVVRSSKQDFFQCQCVQ